MKLAAEWFVRVALASAFLSAVADRFGLWGPPGTDGVAWGSLQKYETYVSLLNWYVPVSLIPAVGWTATIAETLLAIGLLIGWRLQWFATAAGLLLLTFAITMFFALGPKPPLDYSVLSAASAAFLLATVTRSRAAVATTKLE